MDNNTYHNSYSVMEIRRNKGAISYIPPSSSCVEALNKTNQNLLKIKDGRLVLTRDTGVGSFAMMIVWIGASRPPK